MKIPGKATISNRTSTMASQFARARAPYVVPSKDQFVARYIALGIDPSKPECIYCGGAPTEWDHFHSMVFQSRWTGYSTEITNLVPSCGKCNQSRGSKAATLWMRSDAEWSPFCIFQRRDGLDAVEARNEVDRRIARLEAAIVNDPPPRYIVDDADEDEIAL